MRPDRYAVIYRWFAARPAALTALRLANRWLPLASAGAYALLLALLGVRLAAGAGDMGLLARAVLVPGAVFGGGSVLRAVLDRPRPYQQPGFVPLLPKETLGRSFPSRHALSAAVIAAAWLPVLYAGVMSCGVAYTFQVIAQKNTDPTVASLLLSLESVFSALFGWLILRQVLAPKELLGCALVFGGVILAQLPEKK